MMMYIVSIPAFFLFSVVVPKKIASHVYGRVILSRSKLRLNVLLLLHRSGRRNLKVFFFFSSIRYLTVF